MAARRGSLTTAAPDCIRTLRYQPGTLFLLDQTLLPHRVKYVPCRTAAQVEKAIRVMIVRGAPAIGVAAAYGVVLAARAARGAGWRARVRQAIKQLAAARPTAVNLCWALRRQGETLAGSADREAAVAALTAEAHRIYAEDCAMSLRMGEYGARLVRPGARILTHCNAGGLATARYGTALAVIYAAHAQGKRIKVYADETRPRLQGARLTAWELQRHGVDVTLITDNMAAWLMRLGRIDMVFTGADRIAANGDSANKIGTYGVAVAAARHRLPFYIVAPSSTIDLALPSGDAIPIEERGADEVTTIEGQRVAPRGIKVANPAFDVTPAELIAGIVTDRGVCRPPYRKSLARVKAREFK